MTARCKCQNKETDANIRSYWAFCSNQPCLEVSRSLAYSLNSIATHHMQVGEDFQIMVSGWNSSRSGVLKPKCQEGQWLAHNQDFSHCFSKKGWQIANWGLYCYCGYGWYKHALAAAAAFVGADTAFEDELFLFLTSLVELHRFKMYIELFQWGKKWIINTSC